MSGFRTKFRYKVFTGTGDTSSGSNQILNFQGVNDPVLGLSNPAPGDTLICASFSAPVTVLTFASGTITVSANATATGTAVALNGGIEIQMQYPPREDTRWQKENRGSVSVSLSGRRQVTTLYIEERRTLNFGLVNETITDLLEFGLSPWAIQGRGFQYMENPQGLTPTWETVELDALVFQKDKEARRGSSFFYAIQMRMRRATNP